MCVGCKRRLIMKAEVAALSVLRSEVKAVTEADNGTLSSLNAQLK